MAVKKPAKRPGGKPGNKNAEKWTEKEALEIGNELIAWMQVDNPDNIFFEKFLFQRGLYRDVISYLSEKYESFSELIKRATDLQELQLKSQAIANRTNSAITIFCLINNHGYRNKVEHTGDVQSSINFQLVPRKPVKRKKKK